MKNDLKFQGGQNECKMSQVKFADMLNCDFKFHNIL